MALNKKTFLQVKHIYYSKHENLLQLYWGSQINFKMPVLGGQSWSYAYHTPSRMVLSEAKENTSAGTLYNYRLESFLPGDYPGISSTLSAFGNKTQVLLLILEDDSRLFLGSLDHGVTLTYSQSTAQRGVDLSWQFISTDPIQQVEWIEQFYIDTRGHLMQRWTDDNTFTIDGDKHLLISGPAAENLTVQNMRLIESTL